MRFPEQGIGVECLPDALVIFRVVDVNEAPRAILFPVDLSLNAAGVDGGAVFAHCRVKEPLEFRPGCIAIYVNLHIVDLKIARRKHAAHYISKDVLLDGIKSMLFAKRIDKRDLR